MQWKNTVDINPITLRNLGKCQGKPQYGETQRERERERLLLCFRKVQNNNKCKFIAKENTSQHQICPTEIYLVFHVKTVLLCSLLHTSFFVPTVSCTNCSIRPINSEQKSEIRLKNRAQIYLDFHAKSVRLYEIVWIHTIRPHTTKKNNSTQKLQKKISWDLCPPSLENVPSLLLTFLSQAYSKNLSNSPPNVFSNIRHVLHTTQCILL